ncbi:MAG: DUF2182 domain-containing protein [Pseudomonadota bacterium]
MRVRLLDYVDDPRAVTLAVTVLISAALWLATWSTMGQMDMHRMDMSAMPGMGGDEMPGMTGEMRAMPAPGAEGSMTPAPGDAMGAKSGDGMGAMSGDAMGAMSGDAMGAMQTEGVGEMPSEGLGTMSGGAMGKMPGDGMGTMSGGGMAGMTGAGMGAMAGMDMPGMSMDPTDWRFSTLAETSSMWLLMMAAMMLPAMAPVMAIYSGVAAKEDRGLRLAARIGLFTSGYFLLWAAVSIALAMVQLGLRGSSLFTMGGTQAVPIAAAGLMVAAGLYQLSPIKDACLRHCRHPLTYLLTHWREGMGGAFLVGANHGVYCVGCCIVFMGLMFVFGAMNVWWMALIALYFLAEKIAPQAERWGRWAGYALIAGGAALAITTL